MKYFLVFTILLSSIMLISGYENPVFASHMNSHHDDDGKMMGKEMMSGNNHHMSYHGMCAPGFASLDAMCVLDDRCGPGSYPGKICNDGWRYEAISSTSSTKTCRNIS